MTKIRLTSQTQWVLNLQWPEGFLINWKIVTSVNSWNLTVAIKTLAWTDPSTSDPVYCRIDWVVRSITSALSRTLNSGTNYFNAWSAELATKEIDYFVYLWHRAYEQDMQIWISRVPYWVTYNDFFWQPSEKWIIVTSQFWMWLTDKVVNIWRFNAILSAWPSYTWSLWTWPVINYPIFETRELDWLPTISWSWSMTVTWSIVTQKYKVVWNKVFYKVEQTWLTTWWTASTNIQITMPFTNTLYSNWAAVVNDAWYKWSIFSNQINVNRLDVASSMSLSNWWLWANREIFGSSIITI